MNDQLKDSQTVVYPRIHRRSYTETGKKGGDAERAGPCVLVWWLRNWRDIVAAKVPPEEYGVSTPEPPKQSTRAGKRSLHSVWQ